MPSERNSKFALLHFISFSFRRAIFSFAVCSNVIRIIYIHFAICSEPVARAACQNEWMLCSQLDLYFVSFLLCAFLSEHLHQPCGTATETVFDVHRKKNMKYNRKKWLAWKKRDMERIGVNRWRKRESRALHVSEWTMCTIIQFTKSSSHHHISNK